MVASTKQTTTQPPAAAGARPGGTANIPMNPTGRVTAPMVISRDLVPRSRASRSLSAPTAGSISTSHTFGTITTSVASSAGTARVSVR